MHLTLVTEDVPTEVLAEIVLNEINPAASFSTRIGRRGVGYIQSKLRELNRAARALKIVVIADRDRESNCPPTLIADWIGGTRESKLVVRFAEMEVESWIMADRERIARFLEVPLARVPMLPDTLADPKQALVNLARRSVSSRIREQMCPPDGAVTPVGPEYNAQLEIFLRNEWRMEEACASSPSLARAVLRIRELVEA